MIKIAICDDDKKDREKLLRLVEEYMQKSGREYTLSSFESGEEFLDSRFIPDILFLDIIMEKRDGIAVGAELRRINTNVMIIYSTHATSNMIKVFNNIHFFGFLQKPITENDVFYMMYDVFRYKENKLNTDSDDGVVSFLGEKNIIINLYAMDIYFFEYKDRKVIIVTKDNVYICKDKIKDIAKRMERFGFSMSHQCFVVNLYYIENIIGSTIYMRNGKQVCLAQRRASKLRKELTLAARIATKSGGSKA